LKPLAVVAERLRSSSIPLSERNLKLFCYVLRIGFANSSSFFKGVMGIKKHLNSSKMLFKQVVRWIIKLAFKV
jgi:hypothetical protein